MPYNVTDKSIRLARAYGTHAIHSGNGKLIEHLATVPTGGGVQVKVRLALGEAKLHQIEKLYYDGIEIPSQNYQFFADSGATNPANTMFTNRVLNPGASFIDYLLPIGMNVDNQPDKAVARVKCLEIADYNSNGVQTGFGFSDNAARVAADGIIACTGDPNFIDWVSWAEYKTWTAENITIVKDGNNVQVPRFPLNIFLQPPWDLDHFLDRVCQLTCSDWTWVKSKIRFLTGATRPSSFALNSSNIKRAYKFQALSNENRFNGVIVVWRDIDHPFLIEADPIIIDRRASVNEPENFFQINAGVCRKDVAQRIGNYWAKVKCDLADFALLKGTRKTYSFVPGDCGTVTDSRLGWTNKRVKIIKKTEKEFRQNPTGQEKFEGYSIFVQVEPSNPYSDSDFTPLQTRTPISGSNPYAAPPIPTLVLTEESTNLNDGTIEKSIKGTVTFGAFGFNQYAKIYWTRPNKPAELYIEISPDANNQATFRAKNLPVGMNYFKAVAVSDLGVINTNVGGEQSSNVVGYDFQANGRINGLDPFGTPRGQDAGLVPQNAITAKIDAVLINGDNVDVLLGVSILNLGFDANGNPIHNNSDSINGIRVEVFNQFGESVKTFSPAAANRIGGQVVCKFSRKYAEVNDVPVQAYFKIQVGNYFDFSLPVYLQHLTISTTPPTPKTRATCPLEVSAVPFSANSIRVFWQFGGGVQVLAKKVGTDNWFGTAEQTSSPYIMTNLAEYSEYNIAVRSWSNINNWSNIVREFTKQQGEAPPSRPAPTGLNGQANSSNPQTQLDFSCISAANVETEVWVGGSLVTTLSAVAVGQSINYSITGLSANTSRSVKFRHKWGINDYSDFTEEVTRTTNAAPPSETAPSIDSGYYDDNNQIAILSFSPRQGTGNFEVRRKQEMFGSWVYPVELSDINSADNYFDNIVVQGNFGKRFYYQIRRKNSQLPGGGWSNAPDGYEIYVPPFERGGGN